MKLYSVDLSPYSSKVRMQIYAKGLDHIAVVRPQGFLTPAWRATAPTAIGRLPMLELDDGRAIPESEVIAEYLESVFPMPSMMGASLWEDAEVRALARAADIYLLNNLFALTGGQGRPLSEGPLHDWALAGVLRGLAALEAMIGGEGGYACLGRLTRADCALVPALFMVENVLPFIGEEDPIPRSPKLAAYWAVLQRHPIADRVLTEMRRGLDARRKAVEATGARRP
jgi:glutathione S-transferase